jgi:hypothetical protein
MSDLSVSNRNTASSVEPLTARVAKPGRARWETEMTKRLFVLLAGMAVLAGCVLERPRSAYDIFADRFGPGGRTACERYAYETGRQRFELLSSVSGQAFAASNANRAAGLAFERCAAGRTG